MSKYKLTRENGTSIIVSEAEMHAIKKSNGLKNLFIGDAELVEADEPKGDRKEPKAPKAQAPKADEPKGETP